MFTLVSILQIYAVQELSPTVQSHIWRNLVLKKIGAALLVSGLAIGATPALALQVVVTQVGKNPDGSVKYHFALTTDQGETLKPGEAAAQGEALTMGDPNQTADFVTLYNFYGVVEGSVETPEGWEFSSETFGRTPALNGYPRVLPVDVPGTPNLTWTATTEVAAGEQIEGFTATTRVSAMGMGTYTAQVTRELPAIEGADAGTPGAAAEASKQALIGAIPTPNFLAEVPQ